jgi:hypothetical protein
MVVYSGAEAETGVNALISSFLTGSFFGFGAAGTFLDPSLDVESPVDFGGF